jgi:hypothetical protein
MVELVIGYDGFRPSSPPPQWMSRFVVCLMKLDKAVDRVQSTTIGEMVWGSTDLLAPEDAAGMAANLMAQHGRPTRRILGRVPTIRNSAKGDSAEPSQRH